MPVRKLKEYLENNHIEYSTILHSPVYTAQEIAASAHVPGKELAKTVMVKINDKMAMAVVTASDKVDFKGLKKAAGVEKAELASEEEFKNMFPECDIGAMPPFGNLYEMEVFVADHLSEDEEIAFNSGSHDELIKMSYRDFERLVHPRKVHIT